MDDGTLLINIDEAIVSPDIIAFLHLFGLSSLVTDDPKNKNSTKTPTTQKPSFSFPISLFLTVSELINAPQMFGRISEWKLRPGQSTCFCIFLKAHMSPNLVCIDMGSFARRLRIHGHCSFLKFRLITYKNRYFFKCGVLLFSLQGDRRIMLMDFELIVFWE